MSCVGSGLTREQLGDRLQTIATSAAIAFAFEAPISHDCGGSEQRIDRAVEDQGTDVLAVAQEVRLRMDSAVRDAVEVDRVVAERGADRVDVVGDITGAVAVARIPELPPASADGADHHLHAVGRQVLERRCNRSRPSDLRPDSR